jgi:phosphatidylethanolamine/phosphatidyl-N-methylethanolamine N-methyltransferase
MSASNFFKEFLRDRKMVGSVVPSSEVLVKMMIQPIKFEEAKVIVELGPGTGCVTRALLKRMRPDAKLLSLELNEAFCEKLKAQFPNDDRLVVIHDSAHKLGEYLNQMGYAQADYVVSSLPLTNIPGKIKISILNAVVHFLAQGGTFTQFQYYKTAEKLIRKKFRHVRIRFTPLNIPPAFVYVCRRG